MAKRIWKVFNKNSCHLCTNVIAHAMHAEWTEIIRGEQQHSDYYPFSSRITALIFILLRSLHPVVSEHKYDLNLTAEKLVHTQSERVIQFVVFMCKLLDPRVPSLTTVKKIDVPGYVPPTKVVETKILFESYSTHV